MKVKNGNYELDIRAMWKIKKLTIDFKATFKAIGMGLFQVFCATAGIITCPVWWPVFVVYKMGKEIVAFKRADPEWLKHNVNWPPVSFYVSKTNRTN